ncbi:MAG: RecX family transcriptional regulator [Ruminiclostridium sp.]|nr:RecX family transcriptional regulator [Ruminiclostridium sp.]
MGYIEEEQKEAEYERARKRAMYLLGSHDYSVKAMREKLLKNYTPETAERVLEDMTRYGFLDDENYGRKLAASLIKGKKYGVYRAKTEMRRKGVPQSIVEDVLSEYEADDYSEQLKTLIRKKYLDKICDRDGRRKTVNALVRRGFGFSEIKKAVLEVLEEEAEDEDEDDAEDTRD